MLTKQELQRYSRHTTLKEIGESGQEKILNSKILVIGAGGLGSSALLYLAAAGVGTLGIVDGDVVEVSNLQRQIIHCTQDIGVSKVVSAKQKIERLNPDVNVITYQERINKENVCDVIKDYYFVIDATDNLETKFLINDACVSEQIPFSHAGVLEFKGQAMTYVPDHACYRCVFGDVPPQNVVPLASASGVLGVVPGILGTVQAAEALRYVLDVGELLVNKLLVFDAVDMDFRKLEVNRNSKCKVCGGQNV